MIRNSFLFILVTIFIIGSLYVPEYLENWWYRRNLTYYNNWDPPDGGGDCANFVYMGTVVTCNTFIKGSDYLV